MACDDDRCEDDKDYDEESGKGYKSVRVCPQNDADAVLLAPTGALYVMMP